MARSNKQCLFLFLIDTLHFSNSGLPGTHIVWQRCPSYISADVYNCNYFNIDAEAELYNNTIDTDDCYYSTNITLNLFRFLAPKLPA